MGYFAGKIIAKSEVAELEEGSALNLTLETKLHNELLEIDELVSQRVVAFNADALRADKELNEGDHVIITDCSRSPRQFKTKKNTQVATVDLVARRFTKVSKAKFAKLIEKIKDKMFTLDDLDFTSADKETLAGASADGNDLI